MYTYRLLTEESPSMDACCQADQLMYGCYLLAVWDTNALKEAERVFLAEYEFCLYLMYLWMDNNLIRARNW